MVDIRLEQAYQNDITLIGKGVGRANLLGGVLRNAPKSFGIANDAWALLAIPFVGNALVGSRYESMGQLMLATDERIYNAVLDEAVRQHKGLLTFFPTGEKEVKRVLRLWTLESYGNPSRQAYDAFLNMYNAITAARDLYVALTGVFGVSGMQTRLYDIMNSNKPVVNGKRTPEMKLDYGVFIPKDMFHVGKAFSALKRMNDSYSDYRRGHLNLPQTRQEFEIRANLDGRLSGGYLVGALRELTEIIRSHQK